MVGGGSEDWEGECEGEDGCASSSSSSSSSAEEMVMSASLSEGEGLESEDGGGRVGPDFRLPRPAEVGLEVLVLECLGRGGLNAVDALRLEGLDVEAGISR